MNNSNHVVVVGNVAAGKTTLLRQLSRSLGWQPYYEPIDKSPFIEDFYRDPKRWSFASQVWFMTQRFKQHSTIASEVRPSCQDRCIYEDLAIFATGLNLLGVLPDREFNTYANIAEVLQNNVPQPCLAIYVKADVPTLLERVRVRGRTYERQIEPEFIRLLNQLYEQWITSFLPGRVITIDSSRTNFKSQSPSLDKLIEHIHRTYLTVNRDIQ